MGDVTVVVESHGTIPEGGLVVVRDDRLPQNGDMTAMLWEIAAHAGHDNFVVLVLGPDGSVDVGGDRALIDTVRSLAADQLRVLAEP